MPQRVAGMATCCCQSVLDPKFAVAEPTCYQIETGHYQSRCSRPNQRMLVDSGSKLWKRKHLSRQRGASDVNETHPLFASVSMVICDSSSVTLSVSFEALGCDAALAGCSGGKGSSYSQI